MMYRLIATLTNGGVYEKEYSTFREVEEARENIMDHPNLWMKIPTENCSGIVSTHIKNGAVIKIEVVRI